MLKHNTTERRAQNNDINEYPLHINRPIQDIEDRAVNQDKERPTLSYASLIKVTEIIDC